MAQRKLSSVISNLIREIHASQRLIIWMQRVHKSQAIADAIFELAFLRSYLAWEVFLEESFVLYLLGQTSPKGLTPHRYVIPRNREHALEFTLGESLRADWTAVDRVIARANRFFRNGEPYNTVLHPMTSRLNDIKTIRNAVVHASTDSQDKFKALVRRELRHYPPRLTRGGFLVTTIPNSSPPCSFLDHYLMQLLQAAENIVP